MVEKRNRSREYLRVSRDKSGRVRSHDEQHNDNARDAIAHGWDLVTPPYRDVGSASRHAKKARDDFDLLMSDLRANRFDADVLQLWESSRGSRKVGEWVDLLDLLTERGVRIHVHTHSRTYDPRNGRDRRTLLEDAVDSEYESSKTSERALRAAAASAEAGRPHGKLQLGFQRTYDPRTGVLVMQIHDPEKAPLIEELFLRVFRRQSFRRIADDWGDRGITNGKGTPYSPQHLRKMARSPMYAGLRQVRQPDGSLSYVDGTWDGIVTKRLFFAVQAVLDDPGRKTSVDGRARHLLSMSTAAVCDICDGPLSVLNHRFGQRYKCHQRGHVMVSREELDGYALEVLFVWLSAPANFASLLDGEDDVEVSKVRDDLAEVRNEIRELEKSVGAGKISIAFAEKVEPALVERRVRLEARERELTTPTVLADLLQPGGDVRKRWKVTTVETKRAVSRLLFTPALIGQLRLERSPRPRTYVRVEERVTFRR
ncbi:recombinase family protein [Amycolatopsis palatopharyngis]|uniref:recombinase family protein n=1 Tax=Amycolatopsis palatopharyngis TaxID=187982 RepID=UPI000E24B2DB|nr:recombinase family protein [Amycolatopsis palatopharyngis]